MKKPIDELKKFCKCKETKGDIMTKQKKLFLRDIISVNKLADRVGVTASYLSSVLNNQKQPSKMLAKLLTREANSLLTEPYFNESDFRPENNK